MEILLINKSSRVYESYPYHAHNSWEIILCTQGVGTAVIDGQSHAFGPGTIFCIPPGVPHNKSAQGGYTDGCIFLSGLIPLSDSALICQDDAVGSFRCLFELAYTAFLKNGANAKAVTEALAAAMYEFLVSWCGQGKRRNTKVEQFEKLLLDNVSNCGFNLTAALSETGYSRNHFRTLFQACTGTTPLYYLQRLRIEYAKQQFRQNHGLLTVREAAQASGFADPYYFSRVFRRLEGCSPSTFLQAAADDTAPSIRLEQISSSGESDPELAARRELIRSRGLASGEKSPL